MKSILIIISMWAAGLPINYPALSALPPIGDDTLLLVQGEIGYLTHDYNSESRQYVIDQASVEPLTTRIKHKLLAQINSEKKFDALMEQIIFQVYCGRYIDFGQLVEFRVANRTNGVILAAWQNMNHRDGMHFLERWLFGEMGVDDACDPVDRVECLFIRAKERSAIAYDKSKPLIFIDPTAWRYQKRDAHFAETIAQRFATELALTQQFRVVIPGHYEPTPKSQYYRITGHVNFSAYEPPYAPDRLHINVYKMPKDKSIFQREYSGEGTLDGCSPQLETVLSHTKDAAADIVHSLKNKSRR